ncbi:MAG: hypothetical protein LBI99_09380, partial [Propionibacteriaceae bacterium]|nr:hypothetical protein [Propionibacteriaceae bacterium]
NGWEVTRLPGELDTPATDASGVLALAELIRRAGLGEVAANADPPVSRRKGHLAVLADPN